MCKSKSQEIFEYLKLCVTYFSHQKLPEIVKKLRVDYINAIHGQKEVVHKQQNLSFHPLQSFDQCMITHVNFCVFLLTCMFRELVQEFIPIPIFGDVANEKAMVIE